jgi:hypothetical protein
MIVRVKRGADTLAYELYTTNTEVAPLKVLAGILDIIPVATDVIGVTEGYVPAVYVPVGVDVIGWRVAYAVYREAFVSNVVV